MSKRKKVKVTLPTIGRGMNVDLRPVMIEDPFEPGRKMPALKNVETTPLDAEKARKSISEDQFAAGNRFLALYEKIEIGGAKAIRYDIPKVDMSHSHKEIAIGSAEARERLDAIRSYIGRKSYELLVLIVGNRVSVDSIASTEPTKWRRDRMSYHIRKCLSDTLQEVADFLGVAAKGRAARIRAERMEELA